MSRAFLTRHAKSYACQWCGKLCSVKGIKQHQRRCKSRPAGRRMPYDGKPSHKTGVWE